MENSLQIRYVDDNVGFDLGLLGDSFKGIDALFKDLYELSGVKGEIELKTTEVSKGSIIIYNTIHVTLTTAPFTTSQALFDFLRIVDPVMLAQAKTFMSGALGVRKDLNAYFAEYPLDGLIIAGLLNKFVPRAIRWAGFQKHGVVTEKDGLGEISSQQAKKLRTMIIRGKFSRVLKPITDGNVRELSFTPKGQEEEKPVRITEADIENYLPEENKILPQFENGTVHKLTGRIVGLQSTKGEIIKVRVDDIDIEHSLINARPHDGQTSGDYAVFYKHDVSFSAEIVGPACSSAQNSLYWIWI